MKNRTLLAVVVSLIVAVGHLVSFAEQPCNSIPFKYPFPDNSAVPFKVGDSYTYAIKYQFVRAGTATLSVHEGPLVNCRPTYQFMSKAESADFIDAFFVVRDFNSSTADKKTLFSFGFHQNLREGGFRVMRTTAVDYTKGTYTWEKKYKGKTYNQTGTMDRPMYDILSAFFKTRCLNLELGGTYEVPVFNDKDYYMLKITVAPKLEDVVVPAGRFECYRLEPFLQGDGIFKTRDGHLKLWVTADERRMPVLIRTRVAIGAVDAELESFDTPRNDMVNEKVPT